MEKFELTRRRILGGVITIGAGSAAAGAGTFALFSDTESSQGSVSAGTLDLQTGGSNTVSFNASNIKPTDTGTTYVDLQKSSGSSIAGDLTIEVTSVSSAEGNNPEAETNTATGGELDDQLELQLWIGTGGADDNTFDSTSDIGLGSGGSSTTSNRGGYETASNYDSTTWSNVITNFSGPVAFNIEWQFPDSGSNNDAQGDDITVDFTFTLEQQ